MIGIDTNVLLRFLTQDDADQAELANRMFDALTEETPGFLPREVIVEAVLVLERAYGISRVEIARALDGLLEARELKVEAPDEIGRALAGYARGGPGFTDHLILAIAKSGGCTSVMTFDKGAAAETGATLLQG